MEFDGFLKFDGIEGECKETGHQRWIDVEGLSCGLLNECRPGVDGMLEGGLPELKVFEFRLKMERSTPTLYTACVTGREFPRVTFDACLGAGVVRHILLHVEFDNCIVTAFESNTEGDEIEQAVEVAFTAVRWTYTPQPAPT
jgi:type VI secretion system secreted protein Hcp